MKLFNIIFTLLLTIVLFNSCTEDFEELNTQPNALIADNLDASQLGMSFAHAQYTGMFGPTSFQIVQNLFADIFAQYFATTAQNFDSDRYVEVGSWINSAWNVHYNGGARSIKFVEDFTAANDLPLQNAFIKIWKVQVYHRITDYWGPIIYSEFGNGETSVAYDTQESIYKSFFLTLDSAVSVLQANTGGNAFGSNDQVYDGDVNKWLTFANSLRLRLAMRVRYVEPALAKSEAEKAVAAGVMMSNDDNAFLLTTDNSRNPYWTITDWGEFRMSAAMESILEGYEDPRIGEYFSPAVDGDVDGDGSPYEGMRNGQAKVDMVATLNSLHSDMAPEFLNTSRGGVNPAIRVMCSAEVYFLRSEGALLGWNMGSTAQELYETGIEMSLSESRIAASPDEIAAYVSSTNTPVAPMDEWDTPPTSDIPVAFDAGGGLERQLEQIITQKWLALYPDGWEAWSELRRTGYPKLYPRLNSENPDVPADAIFRRMTIVSGEFSNNAEAVATAEQLEELTSRGGDKNSTHVWWDAK